MPRCTIRFEGREPLEKCVVQEMILALIFGIQKRIYSMKLCCPVKKRTSASIAQWLEHWSCKPGVVSSNLTGGFCKWAFLMGKKITRKSKFIRWYLQSMYCWFLPFIQRNSHHISAFRKIIMLLLTRNPYMSSVKIHHQDGRVVKALDLRSNGHMSAWVRTPLLVNVILSNKFWEWQFHVHENSAKTWLFQMSLCYNFMFFRASYHSSDFKSVLLKLRCEQDSNLRGNIPLDFESNALTTRPSQLQCKRIFANVPL